MDHLQQQTTCAAKPTINIISLVKRKFAAIVTVTVVVTVAALSVGLRWKLVHDRSSTNTVGTISNSINSTATAGSLNSSTKDPYSTDEGAHFNNGITVHPSSATTTLTESYSSCSAFKEELKVAVRVRGHQYIEINAASYYIDDAVDSDMEMAPADTAKARNNNRGGRSMVAKSLQQYPVPTTTSYGTNNRQAGVEEPDIVQSNGDTIYIVYGLEIVVVDVRSMEIAVRTEIPHDDANNSECTLDHIRDMLLVDDNLVVFAWSSCYTYFSDLTTSDDEVWINTPGPGGVVLFIYNATSMELRHTEKVSGNYMMARAIDTSVHVVTTFVLDMEAINQLLEPWYIETVTNTTFDNQSTYRSSAHEYLEQILDRYIETITDSLDCDDLQKLKNETIGSYSILSVGSITSLDFSATSFTKNTTKVVLPNNYWHASVFMELIVLAYEGTESDASGLPVGDHLSNLLVYRLHGASVSPVASGTVPGISTGSLDHRKHNGLDYLHVGTANHLMESESDLPNTGQVTVLQLIGNGTMRVVGELTGVGNPTSGVHGFVFHENQVFVISNNRTDPVYVVDTSDPTHPVPVGELDVPGYFTYLHPIGNNLIVGVTQVWDNGEPINVELSLLNSSDFNTDSNRVGQWQDANLPMNRNTKTSVHSEVAYDAKSFRYVSENKLLIIPLIKYAYSRIPCEQEATGENAYSNGGDDSNHDGEEECYTRSSADGSFDESRFFNIDAKRGITDFNFAIQQGPSNGTCSGKGYLHSRSLVFNDTVVTFKAHTIQFHDLASRTQSSPPIYLHDDTAECIPYDDWF